MKQWVSIIAVCMAAVFVFSSVLQFHHHDGDGRVVLFHTHASSEASCECNHSHCPSHHHHHNNHDGGGCTDDGCCTLKLSTQKLSRPTSVQGGELCFSILFIAILSDTMASLCAGAPSAHFIALTMGIPQRCASPSTGLRAPPASIC